MNHFNIRKLIRKYYPYAVVLLCFIGFRHINGNRRMNLYHESGNYALCTQTSSPFATISLDKGFQILHDSVRSGVISRFKELGRPIDTNMSKNVGRAAAARIHLQNSPFIWLKEYTITEYTRLTFTIIFTIEFGCMGEAHVLLF